MINTAFYENCPNYVINKLDKKICKIPLKKILCPSPPDTACVVLREGKRKISTNYSLASTFTCAAIMQYFFVLFSYIMGLVFALVLYKLSQL